MQSHSSPIIRSTSVNHNIPILHFKGMEDGITDRKTVGNTGAGIAVFELDVGRVIGAFLVRDVNGAEYVGTFAFEADKDHEDSGEFRGAGSGGIGGVDGGHQGGTGNAGSEFMCQSELFGATTNGIKQAQGLIKMETEIIDRECCDSHWLL